MNCTSMRELAPELALGALSGEERGRALAHVAECADCRRLVADLTLTADALLLAVPAAEPPAGFESRVLSRLTPRRSRRVTGWLAAAAAVVLALALVVSQHGRGSTPVRHDLRSLRGVVIGTAVVYGGSPGRLLVDVHDAGYDGPCLIRLTDETGAGLTLRGLRLEHGAGSLSTPYDGSLRRLVVVDSDGDPLASTDPAAFHR